MPTLIALDPIHLALLTAYAALSLISFFVYGIDKVAALLGSRRAPEAALHLLSLAGGWPGALLGQWVFRHKTVKQPFGALFWCTVIGNCLALAGLLAWQLPG